MVVTTKKRETESNSLRKNTRKLNLNLCSPRKEKETFTCFTKPSLKKIIKYWNEYYSDDKISIESSDTRAKLWWKINKKMSKVCDNEYCWLSQPFISSKEEVSSSRLNVDETKDNVSNDFRPRMPSKWLQNKNEWLTTSDIENVMNQYMKKYDDFIFIGAVPIDFDKVMTPGICVVNELCKIKIAKLLKKGIQKIGIVFNLDPHDEPGSHWVSFFTNLKTGEINYFDSYGYKPPNEVIKLVKRLKQQGQENNIRMKYSYNSNRHQYKNSECGVYSIFFIENMLEGKKFKPFCKQKVSDDIMEKFRQKYFVKEI